MIARLFRKKPPEPVVADPMAPVVALAAELKARAKARVDTRAVASIDAAVAILRKEALKPAQAGRGR